MQRKSMGGGIFSKGDLPLLSCLAGNDYIDRLYGNGHKKVLQLMQQFICLETQEDKHAFVSELERSSKWKREQKQPAEGFYDLFWKAFYLQIHAPVFHVKPTSDDTAINLLDPDSYNVSLEPLNPLPPGSIDEYWTELIGFESSPSSFFMCDLKLIFTIQRWGELEEKPSEIPQPKLPMY